MSAIPDPQTHLLVIDDDDRIRSLLKKYLSGQGFRVSTAANAAKARKLMQTLSFDLLVLDIMMPGETGLELASSLRDSSKIPILLLTAKGEASERIEGLRVGADDYLAKPFEPEELVLRIQAILRRSMRVELDGQLLVFGDWRFNPATGDLRGEAGRVSLTDSEANLLRALAKTPGEPVSRLTLSRDTDAAERSVDVQMARLRRKIEIDPKNPRFLQTVRGAGYRLLARPEFAGDRDQPT
ncbi:DNA-binding response regulator PetR [hydrothermal vent metagenome]|uniref:DNA-binding response regulator PetR n=1 Tax=hydrothermal vent metagenome TaxID=652676 RepID=A0A3B0R997_9ZZZZ